LREKSEKIKGAGTNISDNPNPEIGKEKRKTRRRTENAIIKVFMVFKMELLRYPLTNQYFRTFGKSIILENPARPKNNAKFNAKGFDIIRAKYPMLKIMYTSPKKPTTKHTSLVSSSQAGSTLGSSL